MDISETFITLLSLPFFFHQDKVGRRYLRPVVPLHTARYEGDEVCPPEYPTLASKRPLPLPNCLRYRCSTPQKQPAATVAFCAPSDMVVILREVDSGAKERNGELAENERKTREKSVDPNADVVKVIGVFVYTYWKLLLVVLLERKKQSEVFAELVKNDVKCFFGYDGGLSCFSIV